MRKRTSQKTLLRRARRTLKFMADYFRFQNRAAKAGVISPGLTWQKVYEDVSEMTVSWCQKALRESRKNSKVT